MLLFLSTSLLFAAPTEPVQRELVAITQALFDSIGSGNADFWAQALADDAFVIDEFGRRQEKPEIVRSIRPFPRMIEIISPGGFERYFEEVAQLLAADAPGRRERIEAVRKRYGLTFFVDANAASLSSGSGTVHGRYRKISILRPRASRAGVGGAEIATPC